MDDYAELQNGSRPKFDDEEQMICSTNPYIQSYYLLYLTWHLIFLRDSLNELTNYQLFRVSLRLAFRKVNRRQIRHMQLCTSIRPESCLKSISKAGPLSLGNR